MALFVSHMTLHAHGTYHDLLSAVSAQIKAEPDNAELYIKRSALHLEHEDWKTALVDLERGRLFCSRDRLGVKPFHYVTRGEGTGSQQVAFSSEIKALLPFAFVPKRLNQQVVYEYLAHGAVEYNQESFFAGVQKLLPGHQLCLDLQTGKEIWKYRSIEDTEKSINPI